MPRVGLCPGFYGRKLAELFSFLAVIRDLNEARRIDDVSRGSLSGYEIR